MRKRILSFVLVFALILSLSTMAYAASSAYTYSFSGISTYPINEDVSEVHLNHYLDIATNLRYSYEARTHTFRQGQFNSQHLSGLMQAYLDAGYKTALNIPASSGTKRVPAAAAEGEYGVVLSTQFAKGTWNVMIGNTVSTSGEFRDAPISYNVVYYRFGPVSNSQESQ